MDEKVVSVVLNAFIIAGAAAATPPFGPIIGQYGVNTSQFCKEFNEFTQPLKLFSCDNNEVDSIDDIDEDLSFLLVAVEVKIFEDRSFSFCVKKPSASFLLMFFADMQIGVTNEVSASIDLVLFTKLAIFKFPNLAPKKAVASLLGTARSIGLKVVLS